MVKTRFPHRALAGLLTLMLSALCAGPASAADPAPVGNAPATQARALIRSKFQATLSSEIAGRVLKMPVREGESFRKGDKLVEFDCNWYMASQQSARAAFNHAEAKLDGLQSMAALRSAGAMDLAAARADAEKARADLKLASITVDRCVIFAPFNGRVIEQKIHAFESTAQNTPLLTVLADTDLEVSLVVPAGWLVWLKPGRTFTLDVDETKKGYKGRITRLGAQIDPISQTVTVFGDLIGPTDELVAGMSGSAGFEPPPER
ncbi:MAG: efflux RND transporter periplasmic adaptor subunit [Rhodospirillaceae bacterium]